MKRKDFLKGCLALSVVPFLPKLSGGKEKLLSRVFGSGFRNREGGLTYGFMHPIKDEIEIVFLEYRRVKLGKKELEEKSGETIWFKNVTAKDKKLHFMEDEFIKRLTKKWRAELKDRSKGDFDATNALRERVDKRLLEWVKWFPNHLLGGKTRGQK